MQPDFEFGDILFDGDGFFESVEGYVHGGLLYDFNVKVNVGHHSAFNCQIRRDGNVHEARTEYRFAIHAGFWCNALSVLSRIRRNL